jgi:hypothetical protein
LDLRCWVALFAQIDPVTEADSFFAGYETLKAVVRSRLPLIMMFAFNECPGHLLSSL